MTNSSNNVSNPAKVGVEALRELLSALEHEQWCEWSRTVAETEALSPERLASWTKRWVSYSALSEADKDLDRVHADRVIEALTESGLIENATEPGVEQ